MTVDVYNYICIFNNGYKIHQIWLGCFTRNTFSFLLQFSLVQKSWKIFKILTSCIKCFPVPQMLGIKLFSNAK